MRGANADFDGSLAAARWLRERTDRTKRKIATVVSAVNLGRIADLARLVRDLTPDVWRLYEYSPWGPQNRGQSRHSLARVDFDAAVEVAKQHAGGVTVHASSTDSTSGCLIVDPSGRLLQANGADYASVGNCLEEPIDDIWRRLPEQSVVRSNKLWLRTIQ